MSRARVASPSSARVRVAVVGLGVGRAHVRGLRQTPQAEVCALCDSDRRTLARVADEFDVAARYGDFARLLARERPDAVVVATPNDLHEEMVVAALEAGADVFCEKPLAHELPAARRIAAAARRHGRRVLLHLPFRCTATVRTAKRFLERGGCGPLYHASTYWARARAVPTWSTWLAQRRRSGGGPLMELGIHRIDLALWFLGEPKVESAAAFTHARLGRALLKRGDVEDFGGGILRCAGGRSVVFEASWAENSGRREVSLTRALGVAGGAVHRNLDHTQEFVVELYRDRRGRLVEVDPRRFAQPSLVPVQEFVRVVAQRASTPTPLPDVARGLALSTAIEAIYRSAREGREVALAELEAP